MRRLLFEIAYQGSRYHGYQVQKNAVTVASVLQDAVEKVWGTRLGITGCSRCGGSRPERKPSRRYRRIVLPGSAG